MRELIVAVVQNGAGSVAVLALAVVATKLFAVTLGPAGLGLISLVRQTYQSAVLLSTLNGQSAVAQGIAASEEGARRDYAATVGWLLIATACLTATVFLVSPAVVSRLLFGRQDAAIIALVRWLGPSIIVGTALTYFLGVLNGHRAIGRLTTVQVVGAAVAAATAYPVASLVKGGHTTAVVLQVAVPTLVAAGLAMAFVMRNSWMPALTLPTDGRRRLPDAKAFLRLAGAMLVSAAIAAAVPLVVRAVTVRRFGFAGVGIFDVAWNVSVNYLLLGLSSFSTYYVPSLSRLRDPRDRQELTDRVLRLSLACMVPLVVSTTVLKPSLIRILYAPAFLPALQVLRWMLVADYLRATSWVFSYTMVAYADVGTWLLAELVWGALCLGGAVLAVVHFHSLQLVGANFVLVYATYLLFSLNYVRSRRHFVPRWSMAVQWCAGLGLILAAAAATWALVEVQLGPAVLYIGLALCFSWMMLRREERDELTQQLLALCRRAASPTSEATLSRR